MGATLSTVGNLLKEVYEGPIQDQLVSEAIGLKRIERTSSGVSHDVGGKYVVFPIRTRRNAGIGARNELEALPTPGQQGYNAGRVSLKYLYGGLQLTGQSIELADKDFQAFASTLETEINGLKNDLVKDQNRQFYGDGTGVIATASAAGAGTNTFTANTGNRTQYAEVGQQIDIIQGSTLGNANPTVIASNRQVTAVNTTTGVITFDGAVATTSIGDIYVRTGNVKREVNGLASIVKGSGVIYNIDPAVEPTWVSYVDSNAGTLRALSEGLMINAVDQARTTGGKTSVIFGNLGVRRAYFNLLQQQRRFTNTLEFEGGFKGLAFTTDQGDIPMVADIDAPPNTMLGIDESTIKFYRENEWSWMDRDGNKFQRVISASGTFDAYEARMYTYAEMGTLKRNAHFRISDITEG